MASTAASVSRFRATWRTKSATKLIAGHKIMRPWLGIRIETLGDDPSIRDLFKGADKGVVVRTIEADAPANKSDLRPFDVITKSMERRSRPIRSFSTRF